MLLKLIGYEMKKICTATFFKVTFVIFLLVNIVLGIWYAADKSEYNRNYAHGIDTIYDLYENNKDEFYSEYDRISALYYEAGENAVQSTYSDGTIPDIELFETVLRTEREYKSLRESTALMIDQSRHILKNLEKNPERINTYKYRYNAKLIEIYQNIYDNLDYEIAAVRGWNEFFTYGFDFFLLLILVTISCIGIATNDRKDGSYTVTSICKYGRKKTVVAKYISVILITAALTFLFTLTSFISIGSVCGYSDPSASVHSVNVMDAFPIVTSMLGASGTLLLVRFSSMAIYAVFIFSLSTLIRNLLLCFGGAIGIFIINYIVYGLKSYVVGQWKHINLISLYFPDEFIVSYRAVSVFEYPVNIIWVLIATLLVTFAITPFIAVTGYTMRRISVSRCNISLKFTRFRKKQRTTVLFKPRSLVGFEVKKHAIVIAVFIVLLASKCAVSVNHFKSDTSIYDRIYKQYIEIIGGEYTDQKYLYITDELSLNKQIIAKYEAMSNKRDSNEITTAEYTAYLKEYSSAEIKVRVLKNLENTALYLRKMTRDGYSVSFVYETGYFRHSAYGADFILIFLIVFMSTRFYLYENEKTISGTPMDIVNRTSKKGRLPLFSVKLLLCISTSLIAATVFSAIDWVILTKNFELPDLSASIKSISVYSNSPDISILQYTVISELSGILGCMMLSVICFSASSILKRIFMTYAVLFAAVLVPHFARINGGNTFAIIDLTLLQNSDQLLRLEGSTPTAVIATVIFCMFSAILIILTAISVRRIKKGA